MWKRPEDCEELTVWSGRPSQWAAGGQLVEASWLPESIECDPEDESGACFLLGISVSTILSPEFPLSISIECVTFRKLVWVVRTFQWSVV